MTRYAVELRNANTFQGEEVEGYLYEKFDSEENQYGTYSVKSCHTIKDTSYIPFFDNLSEAQYAAKHMPDSFYDRYYPTVVEIEVA